MPTVGEVWKSVVGCEGSYQVSSLGRVRSLPRMVVKRRNGGPAFFQPIPGRVLKYVPMKKGYLTVRVGGRMRLVHHLVLEAFVGPRPEGAEARHFPDRDKTNNRAENLLWGTAQDNSDDRKIHGTNNGWTLSKETRNKMSVSRLGTKRSAESVAKTAAGLRGRKLSVEHRAKLSESHKGLTQSDESRKKRSESMRRAWAEGRRR